MSTKIKLYLLISLLLYPLIFLAKYHNNELWERILVPLFVTFVFIFNWFQNPLSGKNNIYLFLAFLFVCAGDYIVNLTHWGGVFIIPFVLVHIFLILYFSKEKSWKFHDLKWLLPVLATVVLIQILAYPYIEKISYRIVFMLYTFLLATMVWRAICFSQTKQERFNKIMIISGAVLFLITDVSVGLNVVLKTQWLVALTWICYVPSLVMLSLMNTPLKK